MLARRASGLGDGVLGSGAGVEVGGGLCCARATERLRLVASRLVASRLFASRLFVSGPFVSRLFVSRLGSAVREARRGAGSVRGA
jgi:hypothetical protein